MRKLLFCCYVSSSSGTWAKETFLVSLPTMDLELTRREVIYLQCGVGAPPRYFAIVACTD